MENEFIKTSEFTISWKNVEGNKMLCVHRVDGQSFNGGVVDYCFHDYQLDDALRCLRTLDPKGHHANGPNIVVALMRDCPLTKPVKYRKKADSEHKWMYLTEKGIN